MELHLTWPAVERKWGMTFARSQIPRYEAAMGHQACMKRPGLRRTGSSGLDMPTPQSPPPFLQM